MTTETTNTEQTTNETSETNSESLLAPESGEETTTETPTNLLAPEDEGTSEEDTSAEEQAEEETFEPITADQIELPEGAEVSDELMGSFLELMNDNELSPKERAQKLIDLQSSTGADIVSSYEEEQNRGWEQLQSEWRAEAEALPELGGAQLPKTLATIRKGVESVGAGKEFFEALTMTGAGNHPAVIKALHSLTKGLEEQQPVLGGNSSGPSKTLAERMFPNQ